MSDIKRRRSFEHGHARKFLVIVDESPEVEAALYFAAARISHSAGSLVLLYVIEPVQAQMWQGVQDTHVEEETNKAKALFRLFRRKAAAAGFPEIPIEEKIVEGAKPEGILASIKADDDIAILVLGAATDAKGPGPLVASLGTGKLAGTFPIPITVVPGHLSLEDVTALA